MKLRVELFYDDEVGRWGYALPAFSILGTGCNGREEAERFALEAIALALEAEDEEPSAGSESITFDVQIAKAS
jgi:predicted RNase H-like HicB family nuclease